MSTFSKTLLCFQRPENGGYVGGLVTLCNDYIDKSALFKANGVEISCFNYRLPETSLWYKIHSSKIKNFVYGFKQLQALKQTLKNTPETNIHIHTSRKFLFYKDVLLAKAIRKICRGKILMTVHVGDIDTVFHNEGIKKFLIPLLNSSVDKVLFLSDKIRHQFINDGLKEERTEILYNFYNIKPISPDFKEISEVPHLLFLGSINREKGIMELLEAAAAIEEPFHLDVCGTIIEESIRPGFESLMKKIGHKATYHGYIGKGKKEKLLKRTDILVLPSYREGLPISILEAMASSCGIITTPVGAIPEILGNENAIVVPSRDTLSLKAAIETLIGNPIILGSMKRANFEKSSAFTDKAHIDKLCCLYH